MGDGVAAYLVVGHEMQKARAGEIDPRDNSNFVRVNLLNSQSTVKSIEGNVQSTKQVDTEEVEEPNAEPRLPTSASNEKPANDPDGSEYCPFEDSEDNSSFEEDKPEASPECRKSRLARVNETYFTPESSDVNEEKVFPFVHFRKQRTGRQKFICNEANS